MKNDQINSLLGQANHAKIQACWKPDVGDLYHEIGPDIRDITQVDDDFLVKFPKGNLGGFIWLPLQFNSATMRWQWEDVAAKLLKTDNPDKIRASWMDFMIQVKGDDIMEMDGPEVLLRMEWLHKLAEAKA
jgi:hypothetical protein